MKDEPNKNDIKALYRAYGTYKFYYDYYWDNQRKMSGVKTKTRKEVQEKIDYILKNKLDVGDCFTNLCWFANISPFDAKDKNGIEILEMILRNNYDE